MCFMSAWLSRPSPPIRFCLPGYSASVRCAEIPVVSVATPAFRVQGGREKWRDVHNRVYRSALQTQWLACRLHLVPRLCG
jgi:hypothetical protein